MMKIIKLARDETLFFNPNTLTTEQSCDDFCESNNVKCVRAQPTDKMVACTLGEAPGMAENYEDNGCG